MSGRRLQDGTSALAAGTRRRQPLSPGSQPGNLRRTGLLKGVDPVDLDPGAPDRVRHACALVQHRLGGMLRTAADSARGPDDAGVEDGHLIRRGQVEPFDGDPDFAGFAGSGGSGCGQGSGADRESQRGARDRRSNKHGGNPSDPADGDPSSGRAMAAGRPVRSVGGGKHDGDERASCSLAAMTRPCGQTVDRKDPLFIAATCALDARTACPPQPGDAQNAQPAE